MCRWPILVREFLFQVISDRAERAALIVTTPERAKDLRWRPVYIRAVSTAAVSRWPTPIHYTEDTEMLATAGHTAAAEDLYRKAGIEPSEIDVAIPASDLVTAGTADIPVRGFPAKFDHRRLCRRVLDLGLDLSGHSFRR